MVTDTSNTGFQQAAAFIQNTQQNIFLTGKAGTGKTTFLKYIKQHTHKQMAIVAPTGVAAINAGGVTIHSFFQFPFGTFIPEGSIQKNNLHTNTAVLDKHGLLARSKIRLERRKLFQQLELLVIDEISMVRADLLDAINIILQHYRNNYTQPFGGVQVLLIGDLYQLPPVTSDADWQVLQQFYTTPFFFSSLVMQQHPAVLVELTKVYRQQDKNFIHLLNAVRNNNADEGDLEQLHLRYQPNTNQLNKEGYITLTTHNSTAHAINSTALEKLNTKAYLFNAVVEGDFSEKSYPADEVLQLKPGAQVMFIKNDIDKQKRYYNGKIGIINSIDDGIIKVQCNGEEDEIDVTQHTWENIRYNVNKQNNKIEEEVIGSFKQYPLRLAWAVTIHKSQGLTFDKVIIDAGNAFAAGQVYVALSRCTSLEGVILISRINQHSLQNDQRIVAYMQQLQEADNDSLLTTAAEQYQQNILVQLFSFNNILATQKELVALVQDGSQHFNADAFAFIEKTTQHLQQLEDVGTKFKQQIEQLSVAGINENNELLHQRLQKASNYFTEQISNLLQQIEKAPISCQSKQFAQECTTLLHEVFNLLALKKQLLGSCKESFSIEAYQQQKNSFVKPYVSFNAYAVNDNSSTNSNILPPSLYKQLKQLRDSICQADNLPLYTIAANKSLEQMTQLLPLTLADIRKIHGFGEVKTQRYGLQFLDVLQRYCNEHNLETQMHLLPSKQEPKEPPKAINKKPGSYTITYALYQAGKSIEAIAQERNFAISTIEGHLAECISHGLLAASNLLEPNIIAAIQQAINMADNTLPITTSSLKEKLGADYSYAAIRWVLAEDRKNEVV